MSRSGNTTLGSLDTEGLEIVGKNATVLGWGMINGAGDFAESLRGVEVGGGHYIYTCLNISTRHTLSRWRSCLTRTATGCTAS